jgi:hypothetical protein
MAYEYHPEQVWIDSAVGVIAEQSVIVDCVFPNGHKCVLELIVAPNVILRGDDLVYPGVVYETRVLGELPFAGAPEDIGETIAFLINDGQMTENTADYGSWKVRNPDVLRMYGIIG